MKSSADRAAPRHANLGGDSSADRAADQFAFSARTGGRNRRNAGERCKRGANAGCDGRAFGYEVGYGVRNSVRHAASQHPPATDPARRLRRRTAFATPAMSAHLPGLLMLSGVGAASARFAASLFGPAQVAARLLECWRSHHSATGWSCSNSVPKVMLLLSAGVSLIALGAQLGLRLTR